MKLSRYDIILISAHACVIYYSEKLWHSNVTINDTELQCQNYNIFKKIYNYIIMMTRYITW